VRFTTKLGAALKMAAVAALGAAALGQPGPAAAQVLPGGTWGLAHAVNLTALPPVGSHLSGGDIQDVSCVSPGNCAAIGTYDSDITATGVTTGFPFVLNETDGTWGTPATVAGVSGAPTSAQTGEAVSCAAPGECAAEWTGGGHTYLIDESGGVWDQAQPVTIGTDSPGLSGVSCPTVGDCTAIGGYVPSSGGGNVPFVMDSSAGTWRAPQEITGVAALSSPSPTGATLASVSCTSAGNCVAGGTYSISSTGGVLHQQPFLAIETGGSWGPAQNFAGMATLDPADTANLRSVSCGDPGDCAAYGYYQDPTGGEVPWVADESGGSWGPAQQLPTPATSSKTEVQAVSCSPQGFCVVVGWYVPASGGVETAFTATYAGGAWTAQDVPGLAAAQGSYATAVSCAAPGYCTVGGYYGAGSGAQLLFLADDVNGTWANAQDVAGQPGGVGFFIDPSCTTAGYCTAVGLAGSTAFTVSEATASAVTLTASTPTVVYGYEGAGTLTATVTSPAGGTPTGTVTVTDGTVAACSITLTNGTGSCTLAATALPLGTDQLTATYSGDANYAATSSTTTITVAKATGTTVTLQASAATVTYGAEQSETLTATVTSPAGGTPTGTVTVTSGSATVCSITLANATGSCTLAATVLPAGTDQLTATYSGDANYAAASSTAAITVVKVTYSGTLRLYKMGLCLDDRGNSSSNGAVVQVWRCNGLASQRWQVESDGTIRHNGLCLDAKGYGTTNGTRVQLWACTGGANQKWDTRGYRIHYDNPAATGKVLDDTGYGGNGTQQEIWANTGTINQDWETT
jgi:hypothetical protein